MDIRQPAVAGMFYPDNPDQLQNDLSAMLCATQSEAVQPARIKALVVPHAGYIYSGSVAATAYRLLQQRDTAVKRVVLLGPSHRVAFHGMAIPTVSRFRTPLGDIELDTRAITQISKLPGVALRDDAHAAEHSLEVQLPFLQTVLEDFKLVPVVVGDAGAGQVAALLDTLWGGDETLVIISSDLSHFLPYDQARASDLATTRLIEQKAEDLSGYQACGCRPLNGLLRLARQKNLTVQTLDLCNSGDTAGTRERVVGYGSYAICQ